MTANEHYTRFTEQQTEHTHLILTVMKVQGEKKETKRNKNQNREVKGDGGFVI